MAGYGDDAGLETWLSENGYTLPEGATLAVMRQRGSDYVDGVYGDPLAPRSFKGTPTGGYEQPRAMPRTGLTAWKQAVPDNVIPVQVINASYFAGYMDASSPGSLYSDVSQSGAIKMEQIGDLKTEYFGRDDNTTIMTSTQAPMFSYIEGMLAPFLTGSASVAALGLWSIGTRHCEGDAT